MTRLLSLGEVASFVSGGTPSKGNPNYWGGDIPWVSAKDMKSDFLFDSEDHVTSDGAMNGTRVLPPESTLVLVRGMTLHNYVPICLAETKLTINQDVKGLLPGPLVRPRFLFYSLKAAHDRIHQMVDSAGHGTGRLNTDQLKGLPLAVPELTEQDRILDIVSPFDAKIELNRKMNATLEQIASALFKSWFIDFDPVRAKSQGRKPFAVDEATATLFPSTFEQTEHGDIPTGWKRVPLGELVVLTRGTTYKSSLRDHPGPYLLGLGSIERNGGFRDAKLTTYGGDSPAKLLLNPGDIFVSLKDVTQSADLLGAVARVPGHISQGRLTQDTVKLDFSTNGSVAEVVYRTLLTPEYRQFCRSHATGTTNLGLAREDFLSYPIPICPSELLCKFNSLISPILELQGKISSELRTLEATRDLLLQWLLSGENSLKEAS